MQHEMTEHDALLLLRWSLRDDDVALDDESPVAVRFEPRDGEEVRCA